ncbi:MAG TPA: 3-deoxy-D-manno-octulosonic acid transferase, partial [Candidatus Binataceae bacterium]|nr:3-deoxy-D-manno-octulosonic acid transferase [Candidatus Binataceae bacterium]
GGLGSAPRGQPSRRLRGYGMLRHLYNALWYPALPVALALSGAAGGAETRRARLGLAWAGDGRATSAEPRIWAHAASVGEVGALRAVVTALVRERPGATLVVTAMTAAGRDAARRSIPGARAHLLAPLDCRRALRPFLDALRPTLVLIAEAELWPNYFIESHRAGARVAIVNGRISERAFGRYRYVRPLLREALACADLVLAQTDDDAHRFLALGVAESRVSVTGNTKFDLESLGAAPLRPELVAFAPGCPLLVAGSTAPGEERIVLDAWRELRTRFGAIALALAPRHLERVAEVEGLLRAARLEYSKASAPDVTAAGTSHVLLLDTMGELRAMYGRGAAAFVGGSLLPGRGGQSLAEPAAAGVPVLFGPFHENQRAIASALLEARAGAAVRDAAELARAVTALLDDEPERLATGRRARAVVERMAGGVAATLMRLRPLIGAA